MKKIIIFITVVLYSLPLLSQSYAPFFSNKTQFNIVHHITCKNSLEIDAFAPCVATNEYFLLKTNQYSYNGKTYFVPHAINGELFTPGNINAEGLLIREDTTLGRIYRYFPSIDNEIMVCDMSLNQGDTFHLYSFINETSYLENLYFEEGTQLVVDTVTFVNGRKIIHFPNISTSAFYNGLFWPYDISIKFIEGVGPTYGPFGFIHLIGFEPTLPLLLCDKKNDQLVYMQHADLGCIQNSDDIDEAKLPQISIFPSPASNVIHIDLNSNKVQFYLNIYNNYGAIVHSEKISENSNIDVTDFPSGIYLLNFTSNHFAGFSRKIIICK